MTLFAALVAISMIGCAGNSGTQVTDANRTLTIASGITYPPSTPVDTIGLASIVPIARFNSDKTQSVLLWGSRDGTSGNVNGIAEAAFWTDITKPLYAKYNSDGGIESLKDIETGSYVTFSALDGASLIATGYDAGSGDSKSIRATLTDAGVTVVVLDDRGRATSTTQTLTIPGFAKSRIPLPPDDLLAGFEAAYRDSDDRTRIITAILRAASLVVEAPFDEVLTDVASFLLLNKLIDSYGSFTDKGSSAVIADDSTTPLPYLSNLPSAE